jgi:hypothetical protein
MRITKFGASGAEKHGTKSLKKWPSVGKFDSFAPLEGGMEPDLEV